MGHQITELFITVFLFLGLSKASENIKPKQYYAILDSGKIVQVEVSRFNKYACPKKCSISHFHRVHTHNQISDGNNEIIKMMIEDKNEFLPISIGNEKIVDLIEIGPKKNKGKKKDIEKAIHYLEMIIERDYS